MSDDGTWELPGITHWDGCGEIGTPEHAGCFIRMDKRTTLRVPPERAILLDLIAELRAQHYTDQCDCGCEQWYECKPCAHIGLCPTQEAAVRAGVRLREVTGDE